MLENNKIDILISVVVVTYNSEKTIIETLNSIYNQKYKNLELIVSDDCSTDGTLKKVEEWIKQKGRRFQNCEILNSTINLGIAKNLNTGLKNATGEFIKPIAGDDLLLESCLEDSILFCLQNNYPIIYSEVIPFTTIPDLNYEKKLLLMEKQSKTFFDLSIDEQFKELLFGFPITTVGLFFKTEFLKKMNYFDTEYDMMEDYPFAFKAVSEGYKLNLLPKESVMYRVRSREENLKIKDTNRIKKHREALKKFRVKTIIPELLKRKMYFQYYNLKVRMIEETMCYSNYKFIIILGKVFGFLSTKKIKKKYLYIKSFSKGLKES